eukprot:CAMPEP_0175811120 /NCGR_PEP_ID=MMETSP0107_2-20121207/3682_1 /TAXON_ID=195067 ORGANISM="Goniomonas pacifica, Strain CCMP1869" /NCGR_SAMPLE_ID=MMETSP0107_2 /ASSEMBLY_ACC=CAM_ASM_000203 /LENGTH=70 /DNA_ID=CAMNT_0017122911 /DNA_START=261 /DNA_END=473 /DNA_ORIENTATION=-
MATDSESERGRRHTAPTWQLARVRLLVWVGSASQRKALRSVLGKECWNDPDGAVLGGNMSGVSRCASLDC